MPPVEDTPETAAFSHGLLVRRRQSAEWIARPISMTLEPAPIPAELFQKAMLVQPLFNKLAASIADQAEWLDQLCSKCAKWDTFVARQLAIWRKSRQSSSSHKSGIRMGILRSDYMIEDDLLKQVELNTMSVSFVHHSYAISNLHRQWHAATHQIPANLSLHRITQAIAQACEAYFVWRGEAESSSSPAFDPTSTLMLMVVQPDESNYFDQMGIVDELANTFQLRMQRATFEEIREHCKLAGPSRLLQWHQDAGCSSPPPSSPPATQISEVSLVYYRTGYSPADYVESDWEVREMLEMSAAIKCPDIGLQLAGLKKVQQELADPAVLSNFVAAKESQQLLLGTFTGLYETNAESLAKASDNPSDYVMKPQREGGGNNLFGKEMCQLINSGQDLSHYILMQIIRPRPSLSQISINGNQPDKPIPVISELGIYGVYLRNHKGQCLLNESAGYLVRSKPVGVNEGGVTAGFAALDSISLVDHHTISKTDGPVP